MPLIRNPFSRKTEPTPAPAPAPITEATTTGASTSTASEVSQATQSVEHESQQIPANGHDIETQGNSQANHGRSASKPVNILRTSGKDEPDVYKLSEINNDGVYLPPSPPTEKRGPKVWRRSNSSQSVQPRDATTEGEPFTISRESFDGYRRSFDISARSPVVDFGKERRSLDVRLRSPNSSTYTPPRTARASESNMRPTVESIFEEVSLTDDQPRPRRGLLSKLVGHGSSSEGGEATKHNTLGARLRGKGNVVTEAELLRIDQKRAAAAAAAADAQARS